MTINTRKSGEDLYEVRMTRKGEKAESIVYTYAKNRLEASSNVIKAGIYGKQHEVRLHSSAAFLDK